MSKKPQSIWAKLEQEILIQEGRPDKNWLTVHEIRQKLNMSRSGVRDVIRREIEKGAMERTMRLYNCKRTFFYKPVSK